MKGLAKYIVRYYYWLADWLTRMDWPRVRLEESRGHSVRRWDGGTSVQQRWSHLCAHTYTYSVRRKKSSAIHSMDACPVTVQCDCCCSAPQCFEFNKLKLWHVCLSVGLSVCLLPNTTAPRCRGTEHYCRWCFLHNQFHGPGSLKVVDLCSSSGSGSNSSHKQQPYDQ